MNIRRIGHIIIGWRLALGKRFGIISISTDKQKLSDLRLSICRKCEFVRWSTYIDIVNDDDVGEVSGLVCGKCGCPCVEKTIVTDESCPESKW